MKKLFVIVLALTLSSCFNNPHISDKTLRAYVIEFEYQASKRGIKIRWKGLRIYSQTDLKDGAGAYYLANEHAVYIDETTKRWEANAEEIVMHELGHAVLGRSHDFGTLNGQTFLKKSVMGYMVRPFFSTVDSLNYRKEYYYDELFNEDAPAPAWAY